MLDYEKARREYFNFLKHLLLMALMTGIFLVVWVVLQSIFAWILGLLLDKFNLSVVDDLTFCMLQLIFAIFSIIPIVWYFWDDVTKVLLRSKIEHRNLEKALQNLSDDVDDTSERPLHISESKAKK